jgi:hypothetical protein
MTLWRCACSCATWRRPIRIARQTRRGDRFFGKPSRRLGERLRRRSRCVAQLRPDLVAREEQRMTGELHLVQYEQVRFTSSGVPETFVYKASAYSRLHGRPIRGGVVLRSVPRRRTRPLAPDCLRPTCSARRTAPCQGDAVRPPGHGPPLRSSLGHERTRGSCPRRGRGPSCRLGWPAVLRPDHRRRVDTPLAVSTPQSRARGARRAASSACTEH